MAFACSSAAVLIAACGGGPALVDIETEPSALVVQANDLPPELMLRVDIEESREVTTDEVVAGLSTEAAADSLRGERVTGFQAQFRGAELTVLVCQAGLYRSIDGASDAMQVQTELFEQRIASGEIVGEVIVLVGDLGEAEWALRGAGGGIDAFVLVWRFRNVLSTCTTVGGLAADEAQALRIAGAQQQRIAQAAG